MLTRRVEAVLAGLSKLEIDETSEEQVLLTVPYLERWQWQGQIKGTAETGEIDTGMQQGFSATISNEAGWMTFSQFIGPIVRCCANSRITKDGYERNWILTLAELFGYRYIYFGASIVLLDGKVSSLSYRVADRPVFPVQFGSILSIKSAHSFWASHQTRFEVSSTEDESPQFRVEGSERDLRVIYTYDAPRGLTAHAFHLQLSCFSSLLGCRHARQIAPLLWQDKVATEEATLERLRSMEPCPSRIVAGRARYLPDAGITLAESEGFRHVPVNVEGDEVGRTVTDFKLIEVLRPPRVASLTAVSGRLSLPYPGDYEKQIPNYGTQWSEEGKRILFFSNMNFDSCRMVPATPEAISAARNTPPAPRRIEDQTGLSLQ